MIWPNGGMVDTTDLKSVIRNGCEGSSPSSATYTGVAQVGLERHPVGFCAVEIRRLDQPDKPKQMIPVGRIPRVVHVTRWRSLTRNQFRAPNKRKNEKFI